MPTRDTPYGAYNFIVEFDGNDAPTTPFGGFSDVTGLGTEVTMMEYRQGNDKANHVRKIPAFDKPQDVTLKRGIMGKTNFLEWVNVVRVDPTHRRSVMITLQDEQRNAVLKWQLINARPLKWTGPTFTGKGGADVAMEELVLTAEGFELEQV